MLCLGGGGGYKMGGKVQVKSFPQPKNMGGGGGGGGCSHASTKKKGGGGRKQF